MIGLCRKHATGRLVAVFLVMLMTFGLIPSSTSSMETYAMTDDEKVEILEELTAEEQALQEEQDALLAQVEAQLLIQGEYLNQMMEVQEEINLYQEQIDEADAEIATIEQTVTELTAEIADKSDNLVELEEELEEANELFKVRLARLYLVSNELTALSVLFSADDFADFLIQSRAMQSIAEKDQAEMEEIEALQEEMMAVQIEIEAQIDELEDSKVELEEQKDAIVLLQDDQQAQYDTFEAMKSQIDASIVTIKALYADNEDLLGDIEADKAAVEEGLDQLIIDSMTANGYESVEEEEEEEVVTWTHPCPSYTYISTYFNITDAWHSTIHRGVDFAAPAGTAISAARAGTVIIAAYSSSYGNYVMIDHGDGYFTLYAHASALYVSQGDTVSQGELIATVGSTGNSSGNHLHFEIRYGSNYLDPMNYL